MVSDAYRTFRGRKKWYFFIEADTYVSTHNLLLWLRELNPSERIYAGAQVVIGDTEFAHGGSGFLMSDAAASVLAKTYRDEAEHWETAVAADCCGDKIVAEILVAASPTVRLLRSFPLVQGETLSSLDWSPTQYVRRHGRCRLDTC